MQINKILRDKKRYLELSVRFLSGFFWLLLLFGFDDGITAALTVIAAIIHELGHLAALFIVGAIGRLPSARLRGFTLTPSRILSYKEEAFVALAGPLANLALAALLCPMPPLGCSELLMFINLLTAISNLLPVKGYDGYRVISSLILLRGSPYALRILNAISFLLAAVIVLLSLYTIYFFDAGYWIFGVFFIFLLTEVKNSLK